MTTRKEADKHNVLMRGFYLDKFNHKCVKCGSTERLELDHIIAITEGGDNSQENIQVLCKPCNGKKGGKRYKGDDHHTRKNPVKACEKVTITLTAEQQETARKLSVKLFGHPNVSGLIGYLINREAKALKK